MRLPASFLALAATLLLADAQNTGPSCSDRMDIVLVIDGSESIGTDNFQKVRSATEAFARQAFNRIQNLRLGIVVYGTIVEQSIYPSSNREEVFQTLENLAYPVNGGTYTDLGIETAKALLNTTSNIRAMVVLTDGLSRYPDDTEKAANVAKSEGITVYSVGVTLDSRLFPQRIIESYTLELDRIATSPQNRLSIDNFDQLSILASGLLNQVCVTQLTVTSGLVDQTIFVGDTLTLVARMSESGLQDILWFKGNTRLPSDPRITYSSSGFEHRLTITNAQQSDSGTYTLTINGVSTYGQVTVQGNSNPGSTAVCRENIDVFLAIDGSNSINPDPFEFELLPAVVSFVDEMFNRTQNGLRMGYVLYSRIINSEVNLSGSDAFIRSSLLGETYPNAITNTHLALNRIKDLFDAQTTDSAKVVMVITDGASDDLAATAQAALNLKAAGVQIIAVGVGDLINQEELRGLASSPDMVILVENFQSLATQLLNITSQCNGVFSSWTEQSRTPCTVPCGGGNQIVTRTRTCSGGSCVGPTSETFSVNCNTATCTLLQRFVDIEVYEGDTFELVAVFGEANIPGATWTKGGSAIFNGGRFTTSGTGFDQTLRVTSTQMTDAGQYVLSVGGVTTFATVTVLQRQGVFTAWTDVSRSACSAPCNSGTQTVFRTRTCQSGTCSGPTSETITENCNTGPCTVLQRLINIQVTEGDTFSLTAVFREANIPGARWTKGGVVVNSNGRFSITGTGTDQTLRVTNSQLGDAGQYTLSVGGVTTLATVTVVPRNTARAVCQGSLDIFLAIDGSNSINPDPFEFDLLPALVSFIEEMFTRTTDLRMGYVLYSTILRGELDLTADSSLLSQSVAGLQYPNGVTNTHLALDRIDTLFTANNRDAAKVVIIITDGASDDRNRTAAAATTLKNKDVQVMAVGVGDLIDQQELINLASSPVMVVLVSDFAQLASQLTNISNQCSGVAVWSEWISQPLVGTPCSRSCGGGTQQRTYVRRCNSTAFTNTCPGSSRDVRNEVCNTQGCPTAVGQWGLWSVWTPGCPLCGSNPNINQQRTRDCVKASPTDLDCPGNAVDNRVFTCTLIPCQATWNNWGQWSNPGCPTCGLSITRTVTRTRTCNQVAGQAFCSGSSTDSVIRTCSIPNCRGTWAAWASWATPNCPACGPVGTQRQVTRNRLCNKLLTTYDDCIGSGSDSRFDTCLIPVCTATWNNWGQWSNPGCPTCGLSITRTVTRTRTCNQVAGQAFCSGSSTDSDIRTCSIPNCRGTWAAWASWATPNCPACGPVGTQRQVTRNRLCNKLLTTYDDCIGSGSDSRFDTCSIPVCTATWNNWGQWSNPGCPTCGLSITRTVTRTRTCNQVAGQAFCSGSSTDSDIRTCNIPNCRGTWAAWASWATPNCPACGPVGTQRQVTRNRLCNKLLTTYDDCIGSGSDSRFDTCSIPVCTATWNNWGQWSNPGCPTCGLSITRTVTRTRTCNQVAGQAFCSGSSTDSDIRTCNIPNCRGTWAAWASWATPNCPTCGPVGTQRQVTRNRLCNKLLTTYDDCIGSGSDSRFDSCSIPLCTATWNNWGQWSNPGCPTCGLSITRTVTRTRTCNQVAGQAFCSGSSTDSDIRTCNIPNCRGTWTAWASWATPNCPACGPVGTQRQVTRNRLCNKVLTTYDDCFGSGSDSRFDTCSIPVCTATWNNWGQWSNPGCPTCGLSITRTVTRTRTCNQVAGQAFCSGSSTDSVIRTCNILNCRGTWAAWASWATPNCPACGPVGTQRQVTRNRLCNKLLTTYEDCIGSGSDSRFDTCLIPVCTATWNTWGSWVDPGCPTCGLNVTRTASRTRTCNQLSGQTFCSGSSFGTEVRTCTIPNCIGTWGAWTSWTQPNCPSCGPSGTTSSVSRSRICSKVQPTDTDCPGLNTQSRFDACSIPICTATWNTWGSWVDPGCPTCGLGITRTAIRTRTCNQLAGQQSCIGSSFGSEVRTCTIPNCIGVWTQWANWVVTGCPACNPSGQTNTGTFTRVRTCNKVATTYADCPGSSTETKTDTCNVATCRVGTWTAWTAWSVGNCSICGTNVTTQQTRTRTCFKTNTADTDCPGTTSETRTSVCQISPCQATWNTWGSWVDPGCPTCGLNITRTASRTRTCNQLSGQTFCPGSSFGTEVRTCNIPNCIGTWTAWASWTTPNCPTCGPVGTQRRVTRNRVCNKVLTTYDDCIGSGSDSRFDTCSIPVCTATWNTWGQWSNPGCPSCGLSITRTVTRTRTCDQVAGQAFCSGSSTDSVIRTCSIPNCRGTWTAWASWATPNCPACGPVGTQRQVTRNRVCNKVLTTYDDCIGSGSDSRFDTCSIPVCTVTWNNWGQWSNPGCPSCGLSITRTVTRTRTCDQVAGQTFCSGPSTDSVIRTCSIPNCRGTWTAWASWATPNCPSCGPVGTQRQVTRNRVCNKVLTTYDDCIGSGSDSRFDTCSMPLCTATWNNWGQWSNPGCPSCGLSITRTVTRTRTCNQVAGQAFCPGPRTDSDIRTCNIPNCRGTWSAWASWNLPSCPSCGPPSTVRRVSRTRVCNKDLSTHSNCAGNNVEYRNDACNVANCTVTPGLCASVMNVSGVGYRYHPTDCDKYVQCYFNPNGEVSAVYRTCPFGHYWSQATMRCDHSWKVTCPHEKCNNTCVTTYNMEGSCRAYWSCDHGRSQAECCAVGFRYVSGRGCFPDLNCRDACPTPCTSADICDKAPAWDKPENYKLNVGFLGWMDSGCIPGSYFDILECGCNVRKNDTCNPEFSLTFNNQNAIAAAKGDWLTLDTVNITNGVAAFTGLGKLVADVKLPEAGVGCPAVLRFRYRENGSGGRQVLASSSDCRHGNTMIIAIHNNTLIFELTSWYGTLLSMPISTMGLAPSQWKDVTFMYNGKVLTGVIKQDNYKVMGQLFAPKVDLVACGLTFGSDGSVLTAFDGQLDEINLYKCDPGNLY
ncbi:uncharacterized protein [Haliotis cracherodii]|uniref:uncharacterized protein isoform X1 n=1 Tax=Haliotis cracherodii TaxID=6455 RepID=UPI0039EAFCF8